VVRHWCPAGLQSPLVLQVKLTVLKGSIHRCINIILNEKTGRQRDSLEKLPRDTRNLSSKRERSAWPDALIVPSRFLFRDNFPPFMAIRRKKSMNRDLKRLRESRVLPSTSFCIAIDGHRLCLVFFFSGLPLRLCFVPAVSQHSAATAATAAAESPTLVGEL